MELLNHIIDLLLLFLRNLHIIFHSGYKNCIPTNSSLVPFCLHRHQCLSLGFLMIAILTVVRLYHQLLLLWFWFALYWCLVMLSTFSYLYWPSVDLFWEKIYFLYPSVHWIVWFLMAFFFEVFKMYFDCMPPNEYMAFIFFPFSRLTFHFIVYFVIWKHLSLIYSWLLIFAFAFFYAFNVISKRIIIKTNVKKFLTFSFKTSMVSSPRFNLSHSWLILFLSIIFFSVLLYIGPF